MNPSKTVLTVETPVRIVVRETWPFDESNPEGRWEASWTEERNGVKHAIRSWFDRPPTDSEIAFEERVAVQALDEWFAWRVQQDAV